MQGADRRQADLKQELLKLHVQQQKMQRKKTIITPKVFPTLSQIHS